MTDKFKSTRSMSQRAFYTLTSLIWLLIWVAMMLLRSEQPINSLGDADNYMRLIQVRDWIDGQGWADLTQHRMNPPLGGDLHWSRLVDMPIALIILALRPLTGQPIAELAALLAVPALLYLILMMVMARLLREIAGPGVALALVALMPGYLLVNAQFVPLRIDHHGWQLLMAGIALLAWTRPGRSAVKVCATACAFWMHVSIEGLPYALVFAGLYTVAYIHSGDRRVHIFIGTLAASTLGFLVVTRGPGFLFETYCDAISAPYLAALLAAGPAFMLVDRMLRPAGVASRFAPPVVAAGVAIAAIALVAPLCLSGPFAALHPLTRDYWYYSVREGLPFWRQSAPFAAMIVLAPLPGVIWAGVVARRACGTDRAMPAVGVAIAAFSAWLIGLAVMRTGGVAQLYALPGMAALIASLTLSRDHFRPRILWSLSMAAAFMLATALPSYSLGGFLLDAEETKPPRRSTEGCTKYFAGPVLKGLGPELLFTQIDLGPQILYHTDLSVVGAGYHRNDDAMATVIRAFISPPDEARVVVTATAAQHLLFCPTMPEANNYISKSPDGLAAELKKGNVPEWLVPDPRLQQPGAQLYRIIR